MALNAQWGRASLPTAIANHSNAHAHLPEEAKGHHRTQSNVILGGLCTSSFQEYAVEAPAPGKVGVRIRGPSQERITDDDMVGRDIEDCNIMIQHEGEFDDG